MIAYKFEQINTFRYDSKMSKRIKESMISNATVKSTKSKHKTKIKKIQTKILQSQGKYLTFI